jgi:hypothetical protein
MRIKTAKVIDPATHMLVWDDGSVTISNIFRGSYELTKEQTRKFVELWDQTVKEHKESE